MAGLIEIRDLSKRHRARGLHRPGAGVLAVDRVSFAIERGSVFGLVGESGCGKTTLARAILNLDPPTSGDVLYDGVNLRELPRRALREQRRHLQIVFQDPNGALDPKMRIRDSMEEGLKNLRVPAAERRRRVEELLELVGIPADHAARWPHEFSGGQKQRIVVARALTMDPDFLVLDEPVSNLDVSIQAQIINLLEDLQGRFGLTYLFIAHNLAVVEHISDRVGVMYLGALVELAEVDEIYAAPAHPYTVALLSAVPDPNPRHRKRRIILLSIAAVAMSVSLLIVVASLFTGFIAAFEQLPAQIAPDEPGRSTHKTFHAIGSLSKKRGRMPPHDTDAAALFQCNYRSIALERGVADAFHIGEFIHRLERTVGLAVTHDFLRLGRAYAFEGGGQGGRVRRVDVNRRHNRRRRLVLRIYRAAAGQNTGCQRQYHRQGDGRRQPSYRKNTPGSR